MGYPSDVINKTINNTILKLNRPVRNGPKKCLVYLRVPYLGKPAKFLEYKIKDTVNNTFTVINTRKPLNGIYKESLPIPKRTT